MNNILEQLNMKELPIEYKPMGGNPRIEDIEIAETYIKIQVEKFLIENLTIVEFLNGGRINYRDFADLRDSAIHQFLINWVNKYFNTQINPMISNFTMNAVKNNN